MDDVSYMQVVTDRDTVPSPFEGNTCWKFVHIYMSVENRLKKKYSKVIKTLHARDFLAEFLATFVLVVSEIQIGRVAL